jgi:hypothetical protein
VGSVAKNPIFVVVLTGLACAVTWAAFYIAFPSWDFFVRASFATLISGEIAFGLVALLGVVRHPAKASGAVVIIAWVLISALMALSFALLAWLAISGNHYPHVGTYKAVMVAAVGFCFAILLLLAKRDTDDTAVAVGKELKKESCAPLLGRLDSLLERLETAGNGLPVSDSVARASIAAATKSIATYKEKVVLRSEILSSDITSRLTSNSFEASATAFEQSLLKSDMESFSSSYTSLTQSLKRITEG